MLVEIDDRTYSDFMEWSAANGMTDKDALKYINRAFRDKFMIDKYGDLNDKFAKPEPKPEPPKAVQPEPEPEPMAEPEVNEPNIEPVQEAKPKPKRKVLKSK